MSREAAGIGRSSGGRASNLSSTAAMDVIIAMLTDGRDGDADLDGVNTVPWATLSGSTYTCYRVPYPENLRVRAGITLKMAGYAGPYCRGDITVDATGVIHDDGNNASGQTAGAARTAGTFAATVAGVAGGAIDTNGTVGNNSTVNTPSVGRWAGGPGGNGAVRTGGGAGVPTGIGATRGGQDGGAQSLGSGLYMSQLGVTAESTGATGGGGAGGPAAVGGGSGSAGGQLDFCARAVTNNGRISANGGDGGNGGGAGAGGGGGSSGGRVRYRCGTWTGNAAQAFGGKGGARGDSTGFHGSCGCDGIVTKLNADTTRSVRVTLSAAEMAAAFVAGVFDVSGAFLVGSDCGNAGGTAASGTGGGGFSIFEATITAGTISLRFNASTFALDLAIPGVATLSTAQLNAAAAGPTFHPFCVGDRVDWRIWCNPSGTMGIRWFVNNAGGLDTTQSGAGATLSALTAASAMGLSAASWNSAASYMASSIAANVVGRICVLGDSISAPRENSIGVDGVSVASRMGAVTGPIVSLAKGGGKLTDQLTVWQGSTMRGNASCLAVVVMLGHNDIGAGDSEATVMSNAQALVDDIAANNPAAKIVWCLPPPAASAFVTAASLAIWLAVADDYVGTGGTPLTGAHAIVSSHRALMGDSNLSLRARSETSADYTHPNRRGREYIGAAMAAGVVASGVAL